MALHRQDLVAVVADLHQAQDTIQNGLKIMRRIAKIGGLKAQKSEQFLHELIEATLRRNEMVCKACSWFILKIGEERRVWADYQSCRRKYQAHLLIIFLTG